MKPSSQLMITTLDEGWCDKDHVLLHACFQVLTDFVEKEMKAKDYPDWNATVETKNARREIEQLYNWWQGRKDDTIMERNASPNDEEELYLKDNEMLKRLIEIRKYLWT